MSEVTLGVASGTDTETLRAVLLARFPGRRSRPAGHTHGTWHMATHMATWRMAHPWHATLAHGASLARPRARLASHAGDSIPPSLLSQRRRSSRGRATGLRTCCASRTALFCSPSPSPRPLPLPLGRAGALPGSRRAAAALRDRAQLELRRRRRDAQRRRRGRRHPARQRRLRSLSSRPSAAAECRLSRREDLMRGGSRPRCSRALLAMLLARLSGGVRKKQMHYLQWSV